MIEPPVLDRLQEAVGDAHISRDPDTVRELSTDHSWMSPILRRELAGMLADVVVAPGTTDELARLLEIAYAAEVAVTMRGRGTGNYGQAVPLAGGIVVDTSRLDAVCDVADGWITAEAGATFLRLEAEAGRTGQELVMFPSTRGSSLAGFIGGGAGGTGSIEHGFIWDGFVAALDVASCSADARPVAVEGAAAVAPFLHAYGTTGVLSTATVRLEPARDWVAVLASFAVWEDALAVARDLMTREPFPRSASVDEASVVALLPDDPAMPKGRVSLRAIVEAGDATAVATVVRAASGVVEAIRPDGTGQLVSLSYNHVTLRAQRARPEICHVQVGGDALADAADDVRACLPGAMLHVDCHRPGGVPSLGGLALSAYRDDDTLRTGMRDLGRLGLHVVDPHTCRLGGHGDLGPLLAAANRFDPKGLLNPGKLPRGGSAPAAWAGVDRAGVTDARL